ncbi:MAG: hypothetical protein ACR2IK_06415 [Chloroflexota bacterium]
MPMASGLPPATNSADTDTIVWLFTTASATLDRARIRQANRLDEGERKRVSTQQSGEPARRRDIPRGEGRDTHVTGHRVPERPRRHTGEIVDAIWEAELPAVSHGRAR